MTYQLLLGDCREQLKNLPDNSVDAIVTDPPYGLSTEPDMNEVLTHWLAGDDYKHSASGFMGKSWDSFVPGPQIWKECLRVLKPGGHMVAFFGSRTYDMGTLAIRLAGFEIRDQIMWTYATGFPKSHNVSKTIKEKYPDKYDEAKHSGLGSSLKPAYEPLCVARKPDQDVSPNCVYDILKILKDKSWILHANIAEKTSELNHQELNEVLHTVQWTADELTNIQAHLLDRMGMLQSKLMMYTILNIVSLWKSTLEENLILLNTSIIKTELNTIIDWKTLKFYLSQIIPDTIVTGSMKLPEWIARAEHVVRYLDASLKKLNGTLTLFALENATLSAHQTYREDVDNITLSPITLARKPLVGTLAENVLAHGTGALNIDECRIPTADKLGGGNNSPTVDRTGKHEGWQRPWMNDQESAAKSAERSRESTAKSEELGRWPANIVHDGSEEVVELFPSTGSSQGGKHSGHKGTRDDVGEYGYDRIEINRPTDNGGSAARFFYCAKASKKDRDAGMKTEEKAFVQFQTANGASGKASSLSEGRNTAYKNIHPTVKPTELMKYLCRLITPPGGTILDPFTGSGSTGRGAVSQGFNFIGIEMSEEYIEIAKQRIEDAASDISDICDRVPSNTSYETPKEVVQVKSTFDDLFES